MKHYISYLFWLAVYALRDEPNDLAGWLAKQRRTRPPWVPTFEPDDGNDLW